MQAPTPSRISENLRKRFQAARNVFVLTGAGVSAESGVPTFRGGGGAAVWKGMPFSVISSAEMVERDLLAVWEWFDYRRSLLETLSPNPGHMALARWQNFFPQFTLSTQNIDGLHQAAGSSEVLELHGSIWRARCTKCQARRDLREKKGGDRPLLCPGSEGQMLPKGVLFGEMLPPGVFEQADEQAEQCYLCFVIATTALVYPAAALPEMAANAGAFVVEVNPERTALSDLCDEVIEGRAGEVLPLLGV